MGHARLKQLSIQAFRSFTTKTTVDFPDSGMILFKGKNLDSGGSSGAGKSSFLLAISYLLGFCRFPGTALQSWLTEEPMEVEGVFEVDDKVITIRRGQKLSLFVSGDPIQGSAKQLEEKITQLLGLNPTLLAALTYRGQKQPGLFLSKTDAEKKEFLTVLLDLGKFETAIEKSQEKARKLDAEVQADEFIVAKLEKEFAGLDVRPPMLQSEERLRNQLVQATGMIERISHQVQELKLKIRTHEEGISGAIARMKVDAQPHLDTLALKVRLLSSEQLDDSSLDQSMLERLSQDLAQAQGFLQSEIAADDSRRREQKGRADSVYAQLMLLEKKLAQKPILEKQIQRLGQDITKLAQNVCPTCSREWNEAVQRKLELQTELQRAHQQVLEIEALKPQVQALQGEYQSLANFIPSPVIQELKDVIATITGQIGEEKAKIDAQLKILRSDKDRQVAEAKAELDRAKATLAQGVDFYRNNASIKLEGTQDELETMERELKMAQAQHQGLVAALNRLQIDNGREQERAFLEGKRRDEAEASLTKAKEGLEERRKLLHAELDFQRLVGREGFLGAIFDEVLWEISQETNRLLAAFPNTAHVTLNFRSESTTQKGSIKKAITPVVTIGGFEAPLSSGLSGGMETAVELAVDLAVATVVSRRTGAVPGWLILDESFEGLGTVEKEASMEILRTFADDKLVLVVDHASEMKEMFAQSIEVEYQGGVSRIAQE